ncbi:unnamed protein product [Notodromas monacha]|uniref:Uncharacterized protein n=1 Tax=Notodromas monacha TaxID=399045 RepID=A0A7R9BU83_9CRUS|nr:unnamed protein product [Notodromas monacha]CAG0920287.1 unnamed protein product [Notodromas monacha]
MKLPASSGIRYTAGNKEFFLLESGDAPFASVPLSVRKNMTTTAFSSETSGNGEEGPAESRTAGETDTTVFDGDDGKTPRAQEYIPNRRPSSRSCLTQVDAYFDPEYDSMVLDPLKAAWADCAIMMLGGKPFISLDILDPGTSSGNPPGPRPRPTPRPDRNRRPPTYYVRSDPSGSWGPAASRNNQEEDSRQPEINPRITAELRPAITEPESRRQSDGLPSYGLTFKFTHYTIIQMKPSAIASGYFSQQQYDDRRRPVTQRPSSERQRILQEIQTCFLLKKEFMKLQGGTLRNAQPNTDVISDLISSMSGNQEVKDELIEFNENCSRGGRRATQYTSWFDCFKGKACSVSTAQESDYLDINRELDEGIPLPNEDRKAEGTSKDSSLPA